MDHPTGAGSRAKEEGDGQEGGCVSALLAAGAVEEEKARTASEEAVLIQDGNGVDKEERGPEEIAR